jgi:ribosomal protein S18 acetylase RimI-like enzyme
MVRVACRREGFGRKLVVAALDFLQAKHVRRLILEKAQDLIEPQADGINVPGSDFHDVW